MKIVETKRPQLQGHRPEEHSMRPAQGGFTLIELMIVVSIIGILASIAIPSYQAYIYRAKATEVILVMDKIKTALAGLQAETGASVGSPIRLNTPGGLQDLNARTLTYCIVGSQGFCPAGSGGIVSGVIGKDLTFKQFGIYMSVTAGYANSDKPGQYKISLEEDTSVTAGNPALKTTAQQIMLAVHHVMQPHAWRATIGSGLVQLYFNMNGGK